MSNFSKSSPDPINFQSFQAELCSHLGEQDHTWEIRDALYGVIASNRKTRMSKLEALPLGWLPLFLRIYMTGLAKSLASPPNKSQAAHHFLILEPAENHFERLASLFRSEECQGDRKIYYTTQAIRTKLTDDEEGDSSDISYQWVWSFRFADLLLALKTISSLKRLPSVSRNRTRINNLILYLTKYQTARRFWKQQLKTQTPTAIYTTYEKNFLAKAFFHEAKDLGVGRRVFWLHGMAHESLQATLSTEMWCMRRAEATYMQTLLPPDCTPLHVPSPRIKHLMKTAGVRDESHRQSLTSVNFLVLGTGNDPAFSEAMRTADLNRLSGIQKLLGRAVKWRFRPHPGAPREYRRALAAANLEMESFSENSLDDDLKWSDAIVAPYSSVSIEAHDLGRIIFWTLPSHENLYGVSELVDEGVGQRIDPTNTAELIRAHFPMVRLEVPH